jgi:O-antigen/teichoic acid export membrane protein
VKLLSGYVIPISLKASADAIGKSVMFIITIVAARRLNPDPFAILALAMATGWLLGVATDCGLSMHLARETARDRARSLRLLVEVIRLRTGLAFVAATLVVFATPRLVPGHWRIQFIVIVLAQLAGAVIDTVSHYFRGLQRSEIEAAIHAAQRIVTLVWALIVLWVWRRLDYLGVALLIPSVIAMLVSVAIALRLAVRLKPDTTKQSDSTWSPPPAGLTPARFFSDVFPLGAATLVSALYFRCDVYFIQQWHGFQPVGGYNAAFRLIEALRLLPAAVMAVTFPLLVRATDTEHVRKIGAALGAIGAALAIVCAAGGSWIVPAVYGEGYAYAAPAFSILALALPLFFLNYALTHQVIGWDGHRAYLVIATVALAANVAANIAFIPSQGIAGAAISTVLTEIVVTIGCLTFLYLRAERPTRTPVMNPRTEPPS